MIRNIMHLRYAEIVKLSGRYLCEASCFFQLHYWYDGKFGLCLRYNILFLLTKETGIETLLFSQDLFSALNFRNQLI